VVAILLPYTKESTDMTTTNANAPVAPVTEVTLELWQLSQPVQFPRGMVTTKAYDNGSQVAGLALGKRKEMGAALNLTGKENADKLNVALLELSDRIKVAGMAEFGKLAASNEWTGKRFAIRQDKKGNRTATMVLKSVKRTTEVTVDQMAASLAKMTPAQREATLKALLEAATKVPVTLDQPAPRGELQEAPKAWVYPDDLKLEGWMIEEDAAQIAQWRAAKMPEEEIKRRMDEAIELYRQEALETAAAK
jgi:hypothetical protein